jgi:hypothetical protein
LRGYSKEEIAAMRKAAESGVIGDILRTAGSRLVPIITGASGGGFGGATAAAAASTAARGMAARAQTARAQDVARMIASRSGMTMQEQRLKIPSNWRDLLRLPPKQAQEAMLALPAAGSAPRFYVDRFGRVGSTPDPAGDILEINLPPRPIREAAEEVAAPQRLGLPAPDPEFTADVFGNVGRMSAEDAAAAQAARQRAVEMGLTPDVVRAQEARRMGDIAKERGSSAMGKFAAQHPDVPASIFENLSEKNWQYLMKLPPDEARTALLKLVKAQQSKKK